MSAVPSARHSGPAAALSGAWAVLPGSSEARFSVRDKLVGTVHGTIPVEGGAVVVADTGEIVAGWVTVSVAGIATGNARRDKDLLKARFLDAERFPTLRVGLDTATRTADRATADGTVLARGVLAPVHLLAELVEASASQVRIRVTGTLDRRPLGIKVPAFVVGRHIHLAADLTFHRAADDASGGNAY